MKTIKVSFIEQFMLEIVALQRVKGAYVKLTRPAAFNFARPEQIGLEQSICSNRLFETVTIVVLAAILFTAPANAAMQDRLLPILTGEVNIAADAFIIGTQDRYIATIVRDIDQELAADLSLTMGDMLMRYGSDDLVIIEKLILDKNSRRFSLAERGLALRSDPGKRLSSDPVLNTDMREVKTGSAEELVWNKIAGSGGFGYKTIGDAPDAVALTERYKRPVNAQRYVAAVNREIGGIFLDRDSIVKTDAGCSAVFVEALDYDGEYGIGGMVAQHTYQPYRDAHYAVSVNEYSFAKKAYRQMRFSVFSPDGTLIYAISNPDKEWISEYSDPTLPFTMTALRRNLPAGVEELLREDIKSFEAYVQKRIAEEQNGGAKN